MRASLLALVLACAVACAPATAPARADAPFLVVNRTPFNLPELPIQAGIALAERFAGCPAPLVLTVTLLEANDLRERNNRPFPFGPRYVHPRGFVDGWATVRIEATLEVQLPGAPPGSLKRFFRGRAANFVDREPALAEARARRPHAGFLVYPGRLDPLGMLVIAALANGIEAERLDRWAAALTVPR